MKFQNLIPTRSNSYNSPARYDQIGSFFNDGDMDRLFNHLSRDFFNSPSFDFRPVLANSCVPRVDVTEFENEFLISAELPGMDEKDIDITVDDGVVTLKGEKKMEKEDQQREYYRVERSYGSFQRSFQIPESADPDKIDASFTNGVLTVKMPKAPEEKKEVKKISIN
ncbi:MAG TPA: Hsp20/alpha crystallin family protein [Nitrospinaceae bacterium]|nr:Hsp20/alpha crystallin family protein [Nitrospinaceae bacterium]